MLWDVVLCSCTMATPIARANNANHLTGSSLLRRSITENAAVVRIFIWYVTWKVAACRLDAAIYCKLFWITDKKNMLNQIILRKGEAVTI